MDSLVIRIEQGWQGIEFMPIKVAYVHRYDGGKKGDRKWPTEAAPTTIALSAGTDSEEDALEQVRLWLAAQRAAEKEGQE